MVLPDITGNCKKGNRGKLELAEALEDLFDIEIPDDDDTKKMKTVEDILVYLEEKVT